MNSAPVLSLAPEEMPRGGWVWLDGDWVYFNARSGLSIRIGMGWRRLDNRFYKFRAVRREVS